jgi:hypothetical protein
MSLGACIPGMLERGEIDKAQAEEMASLFGTLERQYKRQMGDQAAASIASEATIAALARANAVKKRRALLQVQAQRSAWLEMQRYGEGVGGIRALDAARPGHLGEAAQALVARSEYAPYRNVEYQARAIRGQAHATIRGVLSKHRRDVLGRIRAEDDIADLVRARFGEKVDNADAIELSDAVGEAFEMLRLRRNAAGGDTGKLDNHGLPQSHDAQTVADAGFERWRDAILPRLDRARMIDGRTGQPFGDEAMELALRDVFETISSDGWASRTPGNAARPSMAGARDHSRFLHFKSADDWLAYSAEFGGKGSPYDIMMGHIDAMSREIAAMEVLGPNPQATVRWLSDTVQKQAAGKSKAHIDAAYRTSRELQRLYDTHVGANMRAERPGVALGFGAVRAFQVATKLGSAVLSTTSDQATQALARRFNGLPVLKAVLTQGRMLNPASAADREFAVRAGMIWEGAAQVAAAQARMTGEELAGDVSRRLAETTLRISGLQAVTDGGRWAFGMDFLSHITGERGKAWGALDAKFRGAFERYGMGEDAWDALRATPLIDERGAQWILPESIDNVRLRDSVLRMIHSEMDMAVPVATLRTGAMFEGMAPRGTWGGETVRTMLQFKAFPITIFMQQMGRMMALQGWKRASYAAQIAILTTVAGAAAIELKEVAKGRDPRALYDPNDAVATTQFWAAAMLQGGGLGLFGDFLKSSSNRFGGGFGETLLGPGVQSADTMLNLTVGAGITAFNDPVAGDGSGDVNYGRRVIRALKSETPVVGSLWYGRLAYERILLDQLTLMTDNDPVEAFRRVERSAEEQGTETYWAPGAPIGDARAPDLSTMFPDDEMEPVL